MLPGAATSGCARAKCTGIGTLDPGVVVGGISEFGRQARCHGEQMPQRNLVPPAFRWITCAGQQWQDRLVEAREQATVERDPDQEGHQAPGHRLEVLRFVWLHAEIPFEGQAAASRDEQAGDVRQFVCGGAGDGLQLGRIEADGCWWGRRPDRAPSSACLLSRQHAV